MIQAQDAKKFQTIVSRGAVIGFGIFFAMGMLENPVPFLQFGSGMIMNTGFILLDLVIAVYMDKKQFVKTQEIKSFVSTFISLAVIALNLCLYFYLVG
ncbi:MAG TPA: hypothetical protein VK796_05335 [Cytophaga sp.]|jgi:hypothetical protein|nr:hypothetical protein [Cytophaga sp.]